MLTKASRLVTVRIVVAMALMVGFIVWNFFFVIKLFLIISFYGWEL